VRAQSDNRLVTIAFVIALVAIVAIGSAVLGVVRNNPAVEVTATALETPTGVDLTEQSVQATVVAQKQTAVVTLRAFQTAHPLVNPPRPTGIFDNNDSSFLAHGYAIQNDWQQNVNGTWMQAYAGSLVSDPSQGVVLVVLAWTDRPQGAVVTTPTKSGSVKIVAEQNNRLTLQSDSGTVYYFDVLGMAFTPSLTEIVPTVTQLPTFTPVPPSTPVPTGYPYPGPSQSPPVPTTASTSAP
jgi:hypothetical protein